jgi:hypothetical protein
LVASSTPGLSEFWRRELAIQSSIQGMSESMFQPRAHGHEFVALMEGPSANAPLLKRRKRIEQPEPGGPVGMLDRHGGCSGECTGEIMEIWQSTTDTFDTKDEADAARKNSKTWKAAEIASQAPSLAASLLVRASNLLWGNLDAIPSCADDNCECVWIIPVLDDAEPAIQPAGNGKWALIFVYSAHLEGTCMDQGGATH